MKVSIDSLEIVIKFMHKVEGSNKRRRFITYCRILLDNFQSDSMTIFNPEDKKFSKNLGKKFALTKALIPFKFKKEIRTKIWEEFFKEFPTVFTPYIEINLPIG